MFVHNELEYYNSSRTPIIKRRFSAKKFCNQQTTYLLFRKIELKTRRSCFFEKTLFARRLDIRGYHFRERKMTNLKRQ